MDPTYLFAEEKFRGARQCLMLPFPDGPELAIADAFSHCEAGLAFVDENDLDLRMRVNVARLRELMDATEVKSSPNGDRWATKAAGFSSEELHELSLIVDALAREFHDLLWQVERPRPVWCR